MTTYFLPVEQVGTHYTIARDWLRSDLDPIAEMDLTSNLASGFLLREENVFIDGTLYRAMVHVCLNDTDYSYAIVDRDGNVQLRTSAVADPEFGDFESYAAHILQICEYSEGILPDQRTHVPTNYLERDCILRADNVASNIQFRYWREIIQRSRILLVGQPGAGKTTLLRRIAVGLAQMEPGSDDFAVPVYVQLRAWRPDGSLERLIRYELMNLVVSDYESEIKDFARSGRLVFLLDGYDEIPFEFHQTVRNEIAEYIKENPLCRYIVSTRPSASPSIRSLGLEELNLVDLSQTQAKELCWRRLPDFGKSWKSFWNRLVSEPDVAELSSNPLILTLLIARFLRDSLSPHFVGEVITIALEALTDEWDSVRGVRRTIGTHLSPKVTLAVLRRLASSLAERGMTEFTDDDYLEIMGEMVMPESPLQIIANIEAQCGLVRRSSTKEWRFSHLAIQEYLHAGAILDNFTSSAPSPQELPLSVWRYICSETYDASSLLNANSEEPYKLDSIMMATSAMAQRIFVSKDVVHGFCLSAAWLLERLLAKIRIEPPSEQMPCLDDGEDANAGRLVVLAETELGLFNFAAFVAALRNTRDGPAAEELRNRLGSTSIEKIRLVLPFIFDEGRLSFRRSVEIPSYMGCLILSDT